MTLDVADGLARVAGLAPRDGWATLGGAWTRADGWRAVGEVGTRLRWGELYGQGWYSGDAGGAAVGVRW